MYPERVCVCVCTSVCVCVCVIAGWSSSVRQVSRLLSRLSGSLRRLEIHRAAAECGSGVRARKEQVEEDDGGIRQPPLSRGGRAPVELEMEQNRQGSGPDQAEDQRSARIIKTRTEPAQKERELSMHDEGCVFSASIHHPYPPPSLIL